MIFYKKFKEGRPAKIPTPAAFGGTQRVRRASGFGMAVPVDSQERGRSESSVGGTQCILRNT